MLYHLSWWQLKDALAYSAETTVKFYQKTCFPIWKALILTINLLYPVEEQGKN